MTDAWFSRLTLKRDSGAIAPLIAELAPADSGAAMALTHKLMWSVMPQEVRERFGREAPRETTPFLWRETQPGRKFFLLGPRPERDSPFFQIESRPFAPTLVPGDRLFFDISLNATRDIQLPEGDPRRRNRRRLDVAMAALVAQEREGADAAPRAVRRLHAAKAAASGWLEERGGRDGFRLLGLDLTAYRIEQLPRRGVSPSRCPKFGVTDLTGLVEVAEPELFLQRVLKGFGRAKAFGCGLMLLRRA